MRLRKALESVYTRGLFGLPANIDELLAAVKTPKKRKKKS